MRCRIYIDASTKAEVGFAPVPNLPEKDSAKAGRGARKVDIPVVHLIWDMLLLPSMSCQGTHGCMECAQVV